MKKLEKEGKLDEYMIESIMNEEKPNQKERFGIKYEDLRKYFPERYSNKQIEKSIIKTI